MQPGLLKPANEVPVEQLEDECIGRTCAPTLRPLDCELELADGAEECDWVFEPRRVQRCLAVLTQQPPREAVLRAALSAKPGRVRDMEYLVGPRNTWVGRNGLAEHRRAAPLPRDDHDEVGRRVCVHLPRASRATGYARGATR